MLKYSELSKETREFFNLVDETSFEEEVKTKWERLPASHKDVDDPSDRRNSERKTWIMEGEWTNASVMAGEFEVRKIVINS